jgi:hypothetical protein
MAGALLRRREEAAMTEKRRKTSGPGIERPKSGRGEGGGAESDREEQPADAGTARGAEDVERPIGGRDAGVDEERDASLVGTGRDRGEER